MGVIALQLDKLKAAKSLGNLSDIARYLHVHRQTVSAWMKGDSYPEEDRIAQIATAIGEDPGAWLAAVKAERTEAGPAKLGWEAAARRLATAAALVLGLLPVLGSTPLHASERPTSYALCEVRIRRIFAQVMTRWLAGVIDHDRASALLAR
jgi:transcriptional regulator with XRE-family HTH domain